MKDKLKIIFIPTVLSLLALSIVYTFLHWILFIKLNLFGLKEIVTNFGIPLALTGLTTLFILRPRLKILDVETEKGSWRDFYSFIVWVSLTVPLIIAQEYIVTASGQLTELNSVAELSKKEQTKFYSVKNYYIDKKRIGIHSAFDASGKYNENFNMHIYVALPIRESEADTLKPECGVWLGMEYKKQISNSLDDAEKEKLYNEFARQSQIEFDTADVSKFTYLDRIENSDKKEGLTEAVKESKRGQGENVILIAVHEPFEARNGKKLEWVAGSSLIGLTVWLLMLLIPKMNEDELNRIKEGQPDREAQEDMKDFIEMVKPKEGYFVTPILVYTNLAIYILMVVSGLGFISFKGEDLLQWGANYGLLTKGGDWWRLLTNTFLHGGFIHVLANMYGLLFVGTFLEPILGKTKLLTAYLLCGILASVASIWWYDATVSVGASGAIFGLYGLFLAFMLTKVFPKEFSNAFLFSTLVFIAYNLLMGLVGGIDNAAHVGGLLSGFVVGMILRPTINKKVISETTPE